MRAPLRWVGRHPGATVVFAGALLRVLWWAGDVVTASPRELAGSTPDDAYYFLQIARNLAAGRGPTFDGVDLTTGYQPLWQAVTGVLAAIVPADVLLPAALLAGAVLATFGYLALARATHQAVRLAPFGLALGFAIATGPLAWERSVNAMEGASVIAAMGVVAIAAQRWWARPTVVGMGWVGAATGLLCLARTSQVLTAVLIPVVLVWGLARSHRSVRIPRQLAAWAGGAGVVFLPWFAWSWVTVGTASSSAATVKAHWQAGHTGGFPSRAGFEAAAGAGATELWRQVSSVAPFSYDWPGSARRLIEVAAVAVVAWGLVHVVRRRPVAAIVLAPGLAVVGRYGIELLWLPNLRASWYTAPLFTLTALVVAVSVSWAERRVTATRVGRRLGRLPRPATAVLQVGVGLAAVLLIGQQAVTISPVWGQANWDAAQELRSIGADQRIGSFDSGLLGFEHPGVINLDGLVRGPDYVAAVTSGRPLDQVVLDERLDLLVGRIEPGDGRLPSCAEPVWASREVIPTAGGSRSEPVRIWSLEACPRS